MVGVSSLDATLESPALEALLGQPLGAKATVLTSPNAALRQVCGVIASSPQFLLNGVTPSDAVSVPALTPTAASYASLCAALEQKPFDGVVVTCNGTGPLTVASP
jgi:hypothetical protein